MKQLRIDLNNQPADLHHASAWEFNTYLAITLGQIACSVQII